MELKHYIGATKCLDIIVSENDTAIHYGSGSIEVFASPAMISLMENTAMNLVQKYLPNNFTTVGTEVSVEHLRATAVGRKVNCMSKLIDVDGRKLVFQVEAKDDKGLIGKGTHTRFVIDINKFMSRVK
ncbi:thioesterase family protein [Bacteroidota bacterium]